MLHNEARKLALQALEKTHNAKEVAECFSVHISTIYRLKRQFEATGTYKTKTSQRGRKPALTNEDLKKIKQFLEKHPDSTVQEVIDAVHPTSSANETVRLAIRKLGFRRKKKTLHASEQERPRCAGKAQNVGKGTA